MKLFFKIVLIGFVVVLVSGCSAKGPQFKGFVQPVAGQSNVYIYRKSYMGAAVTPDIHQVNLSTKEEKNLGGLKPNGYILTTVEPGTYKFWARTEAKNEVTLKANPGTNYCIEHYISMGFLVGHPQFRIVDMQQCKQDIKKARLITNNKNIK